MLALDRAAMVALVLSALFAVGSLGAWRTAAMVDSWIEAAATTARAERDAVWKAEIEKANAATAVARAEQARAAAEANDAIRDAQERLEADVRDLEIENAALAGGGRCGIGRDRVRLLNGTR